MAGRRSRVNQAAALHRKAAAVAAAVAGVLDRFAAQPPPAGGHAEQRELAEQLRALAPRLAPGWLGATLSPMPATHPTGGRYRPAFVRIGTAQPLDDATFPVVVPLLGTGHLAFDADARDPRVAGTLRALLLRLLAATPPGSLLVRAVGAAAAGATFAPFAPLVEGGLAPPPVTDRAGLRAVLAEAEQRVRPARAAGADPAHPGCADPPDRTLLLVIAALPELTGAAELARIAALAQAGPAAAVHLVVAGWPPPPLTAQTTQPPLPLTTQIRVHNPHVLVDDPPGASFAGGPAPGRGLNSPVYLDSDPPAQLIEEVCREVAARAATQTRLRLTDLLPDPAEEVWTGVAADELVTTVGLAGDVPLLLRFSDATPHWMLSGRCGAGKTAFLTNVLYGLCTRYGPDELVFYLLGFTQQAPSARFTPGADLSWLPHAQVAGTAPDREHGLAVLRELDAELTRRRLEYERAGVTRFAELRAGTDRDGGGGLPRVLCVLDEVQVLLGGADQTAAEAAGLLESLARTGRSYGMHLVLAGRTSHGLAALYARRDRLSGQFPVRIALPGGEDVLDPTNDSAAGLAPGTAVVNTAGGLGGPRGATRGHEKIIRFPDPYADPAALSTLRRVLCQRPAAHAQPERGT